MLVQMLSLLHLQKSAKMVDIASRKLICDMVTVVIGQSLWDPKEWG